MDQVRTAPARGNRLARTRHMPRFDPRMGDRGGANRTASEWASAGAPVRQEIPMKCEEIMKRDVECVSPRDAVEDAAVRMRDENIGFLPVCDQSKQVLGTLTDRDIAIRLVAERKAGGAFVEEIMTQEVVACRPEDDVRDAEKAMAENHKSRIMCVDDGGRLVGVISLSDIAQHERGGRAADTLREVSERETRT
jgi:CBS domain-containing protein